MLAYSLDTVPLLCEILRNKALQRDTPMISSTKGIMRGLLIFLVSEFKVNRLPNFESLVDFACLVYTDEENLCLMFWSQVRTFFFLFFLFFVCFFVFFFPSFFLLFFLLSAIDNDFLLWGFDLVWFDLIWLTGLC